MKKLFLIAVLSAFVATPAMADLFHWSVHNLDLSYDGTNFNAAASPASAGGNIDFTRDVPTIGSVTLFPGPGSSGNFVIANMLISNVTAASADGAGTFTLTDHVGDTITGSVIGTWKPTASGPEFSGTLGNVFWNNESADNDFDGWQLVSVAPPTYALSSVSMGFAAAMPWNGSLVELTANRATWFLAGAWGNPVLAAGSVDAHVVPVPAAVLLGMLGMSVAGLKLRKSV